MPDNLWPDDIGNVTSIAPVTILKQQAALLGKKTKNLVEGKVAPISEEAWTYRNGFAYSLNIVARTLGYEYRLLAISHGVDHYPLRIRPDGAVLSEISTQFPRFMELVPPGKVIGGLQAKSREEFEAILKAIFESQKTRRVVESLLAQSGVGQQPAQPAPF